MNNSKDISYIIALCIALLTTELGNRFGDYITQIFDSNWSKVAMFIIVIIMFIAGYYIIAAIDKLLLKQEQERFRNRLHKIIFFLSVVILFVLVALTQSAINLSK
jgi:uncharacterized membrane protein